MLRIFLAAFFMMAVTACFVDFTGMSVQWLGWTVKLQFMPAVLALNFAAVAVVVLTLLFGRVYCSVVCPLGILQDIAIFLRRTVGRLVPGRRAAFGKTAPAVNARRPVPVRAVRWAVATAFFAGGFLGIHFTWLEPYAIYGRMASSLVAPLVRGGNNQLALWAEQHGSHVLQTVEVIAPPLCMVVLSAAMLVIVLSLAVWKGRLWCNAICPVGTVLGVLARFSLLKPKIDSAKCVKCRLCEKACKAHCIDVESGAIDRSACVACFDCGAVCGKGALTWSK